MSDSVLVAIVGFLGVVVGSVLGPFIQSRFGKTKRERDAALSDTFLKLADITADQLEERINLIGRLYKESGELHEQIRNLNQELGKRDEKMISLEAQIGALTAQLNKDSRELETLRVNYRALWQYMIALLEQMKKNRLVPVDPPDELKSDPEILRILQEAKNAKAE